MWTEVVATTKRLLHIQTVNNTIGLLTFAHTVSQVIHGTVSVHVEVT